MTALTAIYIAKIATLENLDLKFDPLMLIIRLSILQSLNLKILSKIVQGAEEQYSALKVSLVREENTTKNALTAKLVKNL